MSEGLKPVSVMAYPSIGRLAGMLVQWEMLEGADSLKKECTRLIKFSDVWMVEFQAGYLTVGYMPDTDALERKIILKGEAARIANSMYERWKEQNTFEWPA